MPFFFLIGGFTFSNEKPFKEFLLKKARTLLIPYYFFSLYFIAKPIALLIVPSLAAAFSSDHDYVLGPQLYDVLINGNGLWFLWAYFIGEICSYGITRLITNRKYDAFIGVFLILSSISISYFFPRFTLPFRIISGIEVSGFILLGLSMKNSFMKLGRKTSWISALPLLALFSITAYLRLVYVPEDSPFTIVLDLFSMFSGVFCTLFFAIGIAHSKLLESIGRSSIVYYSLNAISLNIAKVSIFRILGIEAATTPFVIQFALGLLLVVLSLIILWIANIVIQRWLWWSIGKARPQQGQSSPQHVKSEQC
jgi:fucose 4-O-acetylase-like acetyltransferase